MARYNILNPDPQQYYFNHLNDLFVDETYSKDGRRPLFFEDDIGVRHERYKVWLLRNHGIKIISDTEVQFTSQEAYDTFLSEAEKLHTIRLLQEG